MRYLCTRCHNNVIQYLDEINWVTYVYCLNCDRDFREKIDEMEYIKRNILIPEIKTKYDEYNQSYSHELDDVIKQIVIQRGEYIEEKHKEPKYIKISPEIYHFIVLSNATVIEHKISTFMRYENNCSKG